MLSRFVFLDVLYCSLEMQIRCLFDLHCIQRFSDCEIIPNFSRLVWCVSES